MQSPDDTTPEPPEEKPEEPVEDPGQETEEEKPEEKPEGEAEETKGEDPEAAEEKPEGEAEEAKAGEPPETEEKRKRAGGWQRKIERLERQNQLLVEQLGANRQPPAPTPAKSDKDKTPEEKATEYFRAAAKQALAEERQQQRQQTVVADFVRRTAEVRAAHDDYDDVVPSVNIPTDSALGQVLLTSEHGPAIMYQLAKSPAELARLSALPALDAAREIGRLEAKLSSSTPPAKANGTTAKRPPAPPTSVKGSTSNTRSLDDLPMSDYKRAYRSGRR